MNCIARPTSATPSYISMPSLRRASVSTAGSARAVPLTPRNRPSDQRPPEPISHTASKTWISPREKEKKIWRNTLAAMHRFGLRRNETADYLPWELNQWDSFKLRESTYRIHRAQREVKKKEEIRSKNKITIPFNGKLLTFDRGSVLAQPTIWCANSNSRCGRNIWPSYEELSYEGDQRVSTGMNGDRKAFRRCLPIVRDWIPGSENLPWGKVDALQPYDFDSIFRIPAYEDIYERAYIFQEDEIPDFLNQDIIAALDDNDFNDPE